MGNNILQLLMAIIVFIVVLAVTYYVTKWVAKSGVIQPFTKNVKVIETFKIAQGKYIQIIQIGSRYYSIGVTKDNITFLTALDEEQLDLSEKTGETPEEPFKMVWDRVSSAVKKKHKNK